MKTFKGRISVQRPNMLLINAPFEIQAVGWAEALVELFRREMKRGEIVTFSITDVQLKKNRASWLKQEYNK